MVEGQRKGMISARLGNLYPILAPKANNRNITVFICITMLMVAILGTSEVGLGTSWGVIEGSPSDSKWFCSNLVELPC